MRINEINSPVQPDTYEASMFIKQAIRAGKYAIQIHNLLSNDQEVEAWVAKKLDLASAYISSVAHYLEGQEMNEDEYEPASREHYKRSVAAGYKGSYEDYKKEYASFPEEFPKNEASKPDFLDMDKDGDKTEPMKKAIKDKEAKEDTDLTAIKKLAGI